MNIETNKHSFDLIKIALSLSVAIYISFYAFESPIRYMLNMVGLDPLIFLRDLVVFIMVTSVFVMQLFKKKIAPYFFIYAFIIGFHGIIMILNTGSFIAVIYSAKMLMSMLFGAIAAFAILNPSRKMLAFYCFIWAVSVVSIFLNKYYIEFPWTDLKTSLFGVEVEVSRDWTLLGADKRAAGFYRASINAAMLVPLLALMLVFNTKNILFKAAIIILTIYIIYLTTMKGALISFMIISMLIAGSFMIKFIYSVRIWLIISIILMIAFPLIFPGYHMPSAEGQFSLGSFNMRVEGMWPSAHEWIKNNEVFPFGVGLGGIGGAQRFYAPSEVNAADNMFLFMYANFGVLTFLYLFYIIAIFTFVRASAPAHIQKIMAILAFLTGYGIVLSIIEDQICSLFIGASLSWLACNVKEMNKED